MKPSERVLDFVGMTRRLIADHELPNKVAAGRTDEIRPCCGCCYCVETRADDGPQSCRVNPESGKEREYPITPAVKKKRVMIAGGGPAAMEAARVAALRGHEVTIYDKAAELGGLLPIAAVVKDNERESLLDLIQYYKGEFAKLGVKVELGRGVDTALTSKLKPDVLIIATGGKNAIPRIPGLDNRKVIDSSSLHRKLKLALRVFGPQRLGRLTNLYMPVGNNVVVMGGGVQGCQLAEFLVKRGRSVTIVETGPVLGHGLPYLPRSGCLIGSRKRAGRLGGVTFNEITDQGLRSPPPKESAKPCRRTASSWLCRWNLTLQPSKLLNMGRLRSIRSVMSRNLATCTGPSPTVRRSVARSRWLQMGCAQSEGGAGVVRWCSVSAARRRLVVV